MFNTNEEFSVRFFSGGIRECTVKFPTDEQWRKRASSLRVVREVDGRGMSTTSVAGLETISSKLLSSIRTDKGAEMDGMDAAEVLRQLEDVSLSPTVDPPVEFLGDGVTITIAAVSSGDGYRYDGLKHTLSLPTQKQIMEYRRSSVRVLSGKRNQETVAPLEPGEKLYDVLSQGWEGYTATVPVCHKDYVVTVMMSEIDNLMGGTNRPEAPTPA